MDKPNNPVLKELIDQLSADVRVMQTQNEYEFKIVKSELQLLTENVNKVANTQDKFSERFLKMDEYEKYHKGWTEMLTANWWKILMIIIPIMLGLGELMVYLRNLPAP